MVVVYGPRPRLQGATVGTHELRSFDIVVPNREAARLWISVISDSRTLMVERKKSYSRI